MQDRHSRSRTYPESPKTRCDLPALQVKSGEADALFGKDERSLAFMALGSFGN
jgi:hypothetical protein